MKEHEVRLARDVARAAAAWLNAPVDHEAYRRLVAATQAWNSYLSPALDDDGPSEEELLDELAAQSPPQRLADGLVELEQRLRSPRRP